MGSNPAAPTNFLFHIAMSENVPDVIASPAQRGEAIHLAASGTPEKMDRHAAPPRVSR